MADENTDPLGPWGKYRTTVKDDPLGPWGKYRSSKQAEKTINEPHPAFKGARMTANYTSPTTEDLEQNLQANDWETKRGSMGKLYIRRKGERDWYATEKEWYPELEDVTDVAGDVQDLAAGAWTGAKGAAGGTSVAGPVGGVAGGAGGFGAGYAGSRAARRLAGKAIGDSKQTVGEIAGKIPGEFVEGAAADLGGQAIGGVIKGAGKLLQLPEKGLDKFTGQAAMDANKEAQRRIALEKAKTGLSNREKISSSRAGLRKDTEPPIQATKDARAKMVEEKERWLKDLAAEEERVSAEAAKAPNPVPKAKGAPTARSIDDAIVQAIDEMPAEFGDKVFISNIHRKLQKEFPDLTLDQFKQKMVEMNTGGKVSLSRHDLPEAFDDNPALKQALGESETSYLNATFHTARKPQAKTPTAGEPENLSIITASIDAPKKPYSNATFEALDRSTLNPATGINAEVLRAWPEVQVPMEKRFPGSVKKIGSYAMGERRVEHGILKRKDPQAYDESLKGWASDIAGIIENDPVYKAAMKSAERDAALRRARLLNASPKDVEVVENVFKTIAREKVKPTALSKAIRAYQETLPATAAAQARKTAGLASIRDEQDTLSKAIREIDQRSMSNREARMDLPEPMDVPILPRVFKGLSFLGKVTEGAGNMILSSSPAAIAIKARKAPPSARGKIKKIMDALARGSATLAARELESAMLDPGFRSWAKKEFGSEEQELQQGKKD